MGAPKLKAILENEVSTSFSKIDNTWRPTTLFSDLYTKEVLKDMVSKLKSFRASAPEIQLLVHAPQLLALVRELGFSVKRASFSRQANHLAFSVSVTEFYLAVGKILRILRRENDRGML